MAAVGGMRVALAVWLHMQFGWAAHVWQGRKLVASVWLDMTLLEVQVGAGNIRRCLWAL